MTKPLGLYVHIPFCIRKCNYCDFCSFAGVDDESRRLYIEALKKEIRSYNRGVKLKLDTVFFGGGTPSLLSPEEFSDIAFAIKETFDFSENTEFTVEANPKTLTPEKVKAFVFEGVNRISVGLQTIHENERLKLGRIHNFEDFKIAIELVRSHGINNVSVDLMYGIPEQTIESFKETLETVVAFKPNHISCYGLIIEEGTPFYDKLASLHLPDEDEECDMYEVAADFLNRNGYRHYEISNYALSGFESRHNMKYWRLDEYIGVGLAAHSYFGNERYFNTKDLSVYVSGDEKARTEKNAVSDNDLAYDFVMLGLRLRQGISLKEYKERFGVDFLESRSDKIDRFVEMGYMTCSSERLALTDKGLYVSNTILTELL